MPNMYKTPGTTRDLKKKNRRLLSYSGEVASGLHTCNQVHTHVFMSCSNGGSQKLFVWSKLNGIGIAAAGLLWFDPDLGEDVTVCELSGVRGWLWSRVHHSYLGGYDVVDGRVLEKSIPNTVASRRFSTIGVSNASTSMSASADDPKSKVYGSRSAPFLSSVPKASSAGRL